MRLPNWRSAAQGRLEFSVGRASTVAERAEARFKPGAPRVDQLAMVRIERLLRHLRALRRSEEGMALPFAAFATAATLALGAAAVLASIDVQQGSHRDSAAKSAAAAADAGANVALMRLNRYANFLEPNSNRECLGVVEGRSVTTRATNGWCPPVTESVGNATYAYQVSAMVAGAPLQVVSTGTSAGTSQRINVTLGAASAKESLSVEGLISEGDITGNGHPKIVGNVGANGSIVLTGGKWELCGNARHGVGETGPKTSELCRGGEEIEGNLSLPPVSSFIPAEISSATYNSNRRLEQNCLALEGPANCDGYSSTTGTWPYDPTRRSINLSGQTVLTLGGGDYWLCSLSITGKAELVMSAEAEVRLFFDTPEDCGMSSSEPQIKIASHGIKATGYELSHKLLGIFMLGGPASTVEMTGTSGTNEVLLYAPHTSVGIGGGAIYRGPIVGGSIRLWGQPTFEEGEGHEVSGLPSNTLYSRQSYVQCGAAAVSVPDESC